VATASYVTAAKMKSLGLFTGGDLKKKEEAELVRHFGKMGRFYYQIARGIDERPVKPDRETKSLAAEYTFPEDLTTLEEMVPELERIARVVTHRLVQNELKGRTITVKIKYADFHQITRSRSFAKATDDLMKIFETAHELLANSGPGNKKVCLLGISISNFDVDTTMDDNPTSSSSNVNGGQPELF
jgi:DNA polymerase-4